ncbi:MAG: TM0106 family RecB-like putative nuclease [Lentisphaeraceae bacterium]|nr:TM0106 family RecB-like putative nuclease [Lentisphaeraceae bacterium]
MKKIFPTELIEFLQCRHMAKLRSLGVVPDSTISEEIQLLRDKGIEHEENYLKTLTGNVVCIDTEASTDEQHAETIEAMKSGADWVYQAYLQDEERAGYADFLQKAAKESDLGEFSYEVIDTKLSINPSPSNAIQLIHYSELVSKTQGFEPQNFHLVHGDNSQTTLCRDDIIDYYDEVLADYKNFIQSREFTEPFPIPHCRQCGYRDHCQNYLQKKKHLALIPGVSVSQIESMRKSGIKEIGEVEEKERPVDLSESVFGDLQKSTKAVLENSVFLKSEGSFYQLQYSLKSSLFFVAYKNIQKQSGALTFYMGVMTESGRYEALLHHGSQDEKVSLQRMVTFIDRYLSKHPQAFLVVSSAYESRLLHDLSNKYNICHDELDELMVKKKIISLASLLRQSFLFPSVDSSCENLMLWLDKEFELEKILEKSPQLLYELYSTLGADDALEQIKNRGERELMLRLSCLRRLSSLTREDFPLRLKSVVLNDEP